MSKLDVRQYVCDNKERLEEDFYSYNCKWDLDKFYDFAKNCMVQEDYQERQKKEKLKSNVKEIIDNYNLKVAINVGWCFGIPCNEILNAINGMRENGGRGHFTNNLESTTDYLSSLPKESLKDFLDVI